MCHDYHGKDPPSWLSPSSTRIHTSVWWSITVVPVYFPVAGKGVKRRITGLIFLHRRSIIFTMAFG
jgi:hypothetical protein